MDTLESLKRKIESAGELESVVKTMKAVAASNISHYEMATQSLGAYYRTIELGILAYFTQEKIYYVPEEHAEKLEKKIIAIIFGSDQGLVGPFNESLTLFAAETLKKFHSNKEVWAIGERIQNRISETGLKTTKLFSIPNSVAAITSLVAQILIGIQKSREQERVNEFCILYNRPREVAGYDPVYYQLLPLDYKWRYRPEQQKWPTNQLPQVVGGTSSTLRSLIGEYLFVSIYMACAESMASENESRLEAMQRAEKNIDNLLGTLNDKYHQLRQSSIDEELFDVIAGFEALKKSK